MQNLEWYLADLKSTGKNTIETVEKSLTDMFIRLVRIYPCLIYIGGILVRGLLESRVNLVVKANQSLSLLKGTPKNITKLVGSLKSKWYIGGVLKNGLIKRA